MGAETADVGRDLLTSLRALARCLAQLSRSADEALHALDDVQAVVAPCQVVVGPDRTPVDLPAWIHRQRSMRDWSQDQLAKQLGIRQSIVSRWERGFARPTAQQLDQLIRSFGSTPGAEDRRVS